MENKLFSNDILRNEKEHPSLLLLFSYFKKEKRECRGKLKRRPHFFKAPLKYARFWHN